jgi:hypothetical protein
MRTLLRLLSLAGLIAGLCVVSLNATSTTYTHSGWNWTNPMAQYWSVSPPAGANISGSVYIQVSSGASGFGAVMLQQSSPYSAPFNVGVYGPSAGTYSNSGSVSGIPAGNYTLTEVFYDPSGYTYTVYGDISATISW